MEKMTEGGKGKPKYGLRLPLVFLTVSILFQIFRIFMDAEEGKLESFGPFDWGVDRWTTDDKSVSLDTF